MFPLHTENFPATATDLAARLTETVHRLFRVESDPVSIQDDSYPQVQSIHLSLDGATLRPDLPPRPVVNGDRSPALQSAELSLKGTGVMLGPVTADLRVTARDVHLEQGRDAEGEIVLLLQSAAQGEIEVSTSQSDLEAAIAAAANLAGKKQGIGIDGVTVALHARGPRGLSAEIEVKARKLIFATVLRFTADLDLDDELNAVLSGLTCSGDGPIGALAGTVLKPHLEDLNGRAFPLLSLSLGDVRLRDVRLSTGERLTVNAEFGG